MWVPVYGKERDCAGTCRLVVLAYDVLEVGGLGGAGPCSSGVYVALAGGEFKGADPVGVPIWRGECWGGGGELGEDATTRVSCEEFCCGVAGVR